MRKIELNLEIDPLEPGGELFVPGVTPGIEISVLSREAGHGFGSAEVLSLVVVVAAGVSSDLIASAIKEAVRGVVRRVSRGSQVSDGSSESIARLVSADDLNERPAEGGQQPEAEESGTSEGP